MRSLSQTQSAILFFVSFGFLKSFKPGDSFLTIYLNQDKQLPIDTIKQDIYSVFIYSLFAWILPVSLMAETIGYRTVIQVEAFAHLSTRLILLFGYGLRWMQVMQITFALALASELVYFSYIFKIFKGNPLREQQVTSWCRAALYVGHAGSSLMGQLLYTAGVSLKILFWISLGSMVGVVVIAFMMPSVPISEAVGSDVVDTSFATAASLDTSASMDFIDDKELLPSDKEPPSVSPSSPSSSWIKDDEEDPFLDITSFTPNIDPNPPSGSLLYRFKNIFLSIAPAFFLYALHKAHLYNIEVFISTLWLFLLEQQGSSKKRSLILNGYADFASRCLGALGSLLSFYIISHTPPERRSLQRQTVLMLALVLITGCMVLQTLCTNIYLSYSLFSVLMGFSGLVTALALTWMAERLRAGGRDMYALALGSATLLGTGIQSGMQAVFAAVHVSIQTEFWVFTVYAGVMTVVFSGYFVGSLCRCFSNKRGTQIV